MKAAQVKMLSTGIFMGVLVMLLLRLVITLSGTSENSETEPQALPEYYYPADRESYRFQKVEVIKVRSCEYLLMHDSYGTALEHFADCNNPNHKQQ